MSIRERSRPVPVALVALSAIPLTAGTLRLIQLTGGPPVIPADHRSAGFPFPLMVHVLDATTYALVGILQFLSRFAAGAWPGTVAQAGGWPWPACWWQSQRCWMTLFSEPQPGARRRRYVLRLVFSSAMAACLSTSTASGMAKRLTARTTVTSMTVTIFRRIAHRPFRGMVASRPVRPRCDPDGDDPDWRRATIRSGCRRGPRR
jgi:hypothetical protein